MVKATHKPPSRIRYEQSHPTVSCRLDSETHTLLQQRLEELGEVSFADFVKDALGTLQLKMPDVKAISKTAREEGYKQAKKDYEIWYFCKVCRKPITISPNSDSHKAVIGHMEGWRHTACGE